MARLQLFVLNLTLLSMTALAQEWLEGGYVGSPDYGETRQYFTDPIFFTIVPVSQPLSFYSPYVVNMGIYPFSAFQSEFRSSSLAEMQWVPQQKNWTATMSYAQGKSSLRVFEDGAWRSL